MLLARENADRYSIASHLGRMSMNRQFACGLLLCSMSIAVLAPGRSYTQNPQTSNASPPTAQPKDVDSIEHILAAVYDSISGPAGPRDWDRFRPLFYSGARLMPSRRDDKGKITANALTVDDYIARAGDYFAKEGFFESPVGNRIETWDHIAHVWSTYESRHAIED